MKAQTKPAFRTAVAARVAGEDIYRGDYVTALNEVVELPSFLWCCSAASLPADETVGIRFMARDAGQPYKVVAVCLPFVYVKRPKGDVFAVDTRQLQLVRLDRDSGRHVWKQMRKTLQQKKK